MDGAFRYKAFISYSWKDRRAAERLHHALETFRTPKDFVGRATPDGPAPRRLHPIFKDREEEAAGASLRGAIEEALDNSEFLIVICSPAAVESRWVTKEIAYFRKRRDPRKVLPYIIGGEPLASLAPERMAEECFPEAMRVETGEDGTPTGAAIEAPLAADARKSGDGARPALLKIAAAMLSVGLDDLVRRDAQRRARAMRLALGAASSIALAMSALALYAVDQRDEARAQRAVAEKERDTATAALDFLVSTYELANPATENPKTVTALSILERGEKKIDTDLVGEPEVQAKLLSALGAVYHNLGDIDQAERLLTRATKVSGAPTRERLAADLQLSWIALKRRDLGRAGARLAALDVGVAAAAKAGAISPAEARDFAISLGEHRAYHAYLSGEADDAIALYTQAIDLIDPDAPDAARRGAKLATNRGMILVARKDFAAGRADLDRARAFFADHYGEGHLLTAQATHNIAYAEFEAKRYDGAIAEMRAALAVYERVLSPNHPDLATAHKLFGTMLTAAGEPAQAIAPLKAAVAGFQAAYGLNYYDAGYSLVYLAAAYADAGMPAEALAAIDRAEAIYGKNFEPDGFDFGDLKVYRALVYAKAGRRAEAPPLCAAGLLILKANLAADDPYFVDMASKCARL